MQRKIVMNRRFFTSESVTEGHPDKVSDRVSDAVLDAIIAQDPTARVACETFCTTGVVTVNGTEEDYSNELTSQQFDIAFPITVPEGTVFVLGDNRGNSLDSRSTRVGCVDERLIVGKVLFRFFPLGDWKVE